MLWLLRHAEAADGQPDDTRPLTERGLRDARATGLALAQLGIKLDTCLSSPKLRALETAELACAPLRLQVETAAELAHSSYDAEALAAGHGDVLLVGHDPSISLALRDMTGVRAKMKKCALAAVDRGELRLLLTPRELNAIAAGAQP